VKAKAFGRSKRKASPDGLLSMSEITLVGSPAELRRIAEFITKAAGELEKHGESFGHCHLQDEGDLRPWSDEGVDVIIARG
jgi:hypothetical protein